MRRILPIVLAVFATACKPDFATVEEACDDKVPGSGNIDDEVAVGVFARINCYRRLAKLSRANMDKQIQDAVASHNSYQQQNFVVEDWPSKLGQEEAGMPGFTGAGAYDRLEEAGYANTDRGSLGLWEYIYWDDEKAESRIDFWFHDPQARQSFLQPAWVGGGYADGPLANITEDMGLSPNMAYMNIFYQIPVLDHAGTPVFYPKDGQEEVPTGFEAVDPDNPVIGLGVIGYPITLTVGAAEYGGGANAHNIAVKNATLKGPSGNVEVEIYTPDTDPFLRYTASVYPLTQLEPNSTYTFTVKMDWTENEGREFTTEFTTGGAFVPHGVEAFSRRGAPEKPILRHRVIDPDALLP